MTIKTGLTVPKFKRVIDDETGDRVGLICYQFDFDKNIVMAGLSMCHPEDIYDHEIGKNIALQRLMRKDEHYIEVDVYDFITFGEQIESSYEYSKFRNAITILGRYVKEAKQNEFHRRLSTLLRSEVGPLNIDAVPFNTIMSAIYNKFNIPTMEYR